MGFLYDHTIPRRPQPMTTIVTSLLPSLRESFILADLRNKFFVLLMMAVMVMWYKRGNWLYAAYYTTSQRTD